MDRPCECPQEQGRGQQHDDDLDLDLDLDLEANNTDEWREGSYTGLLMMEGGPYALGYKATANSSNSSCFS
jgi:hypothetical protein